MVPKSVEISRETLSEGILQKLASEGPGQPVELLTEEELLESRRSFIKDSISWGAGPRASQFLILGSKAKAALDGRPTANIDDIKSLAIPILRHRVLTNFNAETEGLKIEDIILQLIEDIE